MDAICVLFLLSLPVRSSSVSVVFDFNASLNDVVPVSPMSLSVCLKKGGMLTDFICVLFLSLQPRLSFVRVVFDLNASLIDVAPFSPILFTVVLMRIEEWIVDGCHLCVVPFVFTFQIEFCECCV